MASTVSSMGSEISELALPLLALITLSASASELSVMRVAQFLPFLLATLPLGMLVDRRSASRLSLMVGADVARFLLTASIPIAVLLHVGGMGLLYVVVFAAGTMTVLYQIADFALLPSLVPKDHLVDANGKIAASQSASEIGGRGAGGLLVAALSAPIAVALDALSYLLSALSLRRIETRPATDVAAQQRISWADVTEGMRIAVRSRYIRALVGEAATFNLFNEVFILGFLIYCVRVLDIGPAGIGIVFTAGGIGSFCGAWFGARLTGRFGYGRVLLLSLVAGNSAPIATVWLGAGSDTRGNLALLCSVFLVMGVGIGIANVHAVSLRQAAVGEQLLGRVNAAYRMISWGAIPAGAAVGGVVVAQAGPRAAMVAGAVGLSTATLWVALSAVAKLRRISDADAG